MSVRGLTESTVFGSGLTVQQQRGILKAIYVTDDAVTYATVDVDQIGVLANLQSLVNSSNDASACTSLVSRLSYWTDTYSVVGWIANESLSLSSVFRQCRTQA